MNITLTYNHFLIQLTPYEPVSILYDLQKRLSYCDLDFKLRMFQKAIGEVPTLEYDNPEWITKVMPATEGFRDQQNFLCKKYNQATEATRINYNFKTGYSFEDKHATKSRMSIVAIDKPNKRSYNIPSGFLRDTILFLQKYYPSIRYNIDDTRKDNILNYLRKPITSLNDDGTQITLRERQAEAVNKIIHTLGDTENLGHYFSDASLNLAPNFGKTYVSDCIIRSLSNAPTIAFYRSTALAAKAVDEYSKQGFQVGTIMSSYTKLNKYLRAKGNTYGYTKGIAPLTVAMVPTLHSRLKSNRITPEELAYFKVGLFDEADKLVTPKFVKVYQKFQLLLKLLMSGSLTASPKGEVQFALRGLGGAQRMKYTYAESRDAGHSLPITYRSIPLNIGAQKLLMEGVDGGLKELKKHIVFKSKKRLKDVENILQLHKDAHVLVFAGGSEVEDMQYLYDHLKGKGVDVRMTWGADPDRVKNEDEFYAGKFQVLISNQILGVGVNLPRVSVVINWGTRGSYEEFLQSPLGRLCRTFKGITQGFIYDWFIDDVRGKLWVNSVMRLYFAKKEKLEVEENYTF